MAEAPPLARAFDQPGDVSDGELPRTVRRIDGAENRCKRRERVLGHFRPRVRDPREQRRLARIGQSDQGRIGDQLEPQLERRLFTGKPGLCEARRAPRRRGETLVAAAGVPSARDDHSGAGSREIDDELSVLFEDLRSDRHRKRHRLPGRAVLQCAATRFAASGLEASLGPKRGKIAEIQVGREDDVSTRAAVSAVGSTLRHVLLAAEVQAPVTAATRLHMDAGAVVEHVRLVR